MALTPEDVVNKRFQPTKFREGYDQDEVDDFLDEVVVELRRLTQENEELRQRVIADESRISELQRSSGQAPTVAATPEPVSALAQEPVAAVVAAPFVAPVPVVAPVAAAPIEASDPSDPTNLLQLARRLHEEHVREGVAKRDALIAEGESAAASLVSEAEERQRTELSTLEKERAGLERKIEELRTFEREYREKLKSYIQGQLRELDSTNTIDATASNAEGAVAPQPASFSGFAGGN